MHWFDGGVTVLVLVFGAWGVFRGFIREVMSLLGFMAAFVLAAHGYPYVAPLLENVITTEWARQAVSVALIFVVVMLLAAVCSRLLRLMLHVVGLSLLDRFLGGVFGVVKVMLVVAGLLMMNEQFSPGFTRQLRAKSALAPVFFQTADMLAMALAQKDYDAFKHLSEQAMQPLQNLLLPPQTVPMVVEKWRQQPSATLPDPPVPGPTAPPPAAPIPPAARPKSLPLETPQEPPPAGPPPPVAQRPAEPTAPQEPGSADSPSGISDADSKALERMLREHFKERRR